MTTYWRINPVIWDDEQFVDLDDLARTVWWVLLAGPQLTVVPGLQRTSAAAVADTLRRPVEGVEAALAELERRGMIERDVKRRVLRVVNAPKHNPAESPNHIKAWWRRWQEIPDCDLKLAHVASLRDAAGLTNPSHREVWDKTFGSLAPAAAEPSGSPPEALPKGSPRPTEGVPEDLPNSASASATANASPHSPPAGGEAAQLTLVPDEPPAGPDPAVVLFDLWRVTYDHGRSVLDTKRRDRIEKWVGICGFEQCRRAILGAQHDDWLMKRDPKSPRKYDGLETILRDAAQIERLADLCDEPRADDAPPATVAPPPPPLAPEEPPAPASLSLAGNLRRIRFGEPALAPTGTEGDGG